MGSTCLGRAVWASCIVLQTGHALAGEIDIATGVMAENRHAYMSAGCYQCHGTVGQGGVGPRLAPKPMALPALTAFVRNSPRSMPAYDERVLTAEDLRKIFDYLAAIDASPAPAAIQQLNP